MAVQISGNDITVPRDGSFTRNVTIGGTLTYEDVTNIDSVGLVTARTGIEIGARPGVAASISVDGNMIISGISTFGDDVKINVDSKKILLGAGADLEVFHNGTNSHLRTQTGNLIIDNNSGGTVNIRPKIGEEGIVCTTDGSTALYHDGTKKFETISTGVVITGSDDGDGGAKGDFKFFQTDGTLKIMFDASTSQFEFLDNSKASFGNGDDLKIFHDGSGSHITESGTGLLDIDTNTFRVRNTAGSENQITAEANGAVQLYYDNSIKLATTNTGTVTTGIATATEFVPTVGQLSHRNLIINGAMQVCQRYSLASMNNISNNTHTYHTDRFKGYNGNGGILGLEWQENYPEGYHYSLRIKCVTADTSVDGLTFISHVIEDKNIQHLNYGLSYAKSCTLSFWIKSNLTGTYSVGLINDTQGSRGFVAEYTISAANTWEKKTITVPGDTSGTWNAGGLRVHWALAIQSDRRTSTLNSWHTTSSVQYCSTNQPNFMSSTNNYMNLTGVQFEVGSATPYEHVSYGDELARCQRYYQDINPRATGWIVSATQVRFSVDWVTQMRANPTCTLGGSFVQYGPGGQQTGTLQGFGDISVNGCIPILNTSGGMTTNAPATGGISMTADAEL